MATNNKINTDHMIASCGHHDIFGYLVHTVCKACADKGHREVFGRNRHSPRGKAKVGA